MRSVPLQDSNYSLISPIWQGNTTTPHQALRDPGPSSRPNRVAHLAQRMTFIPSPANLDITAPLQMTKGLPVLSIMGAVTPFLQPGAKSLQSLAAGKDQTVGEMSFDADSHGSSMIQR